MTCRSRILPLGPRLRHPGQLKQLRMANGLQILFLGDAHHLQVGLRVLIFTTNMLKNIMKVSSRPLGRKRRNAFVEQDGQVSAQMSLQTMTEKLNTFQVGASDVAVLFA